MNSVHITDTVSEDRHSVLVDAPGGEPPRMVVYGEVDGPNAVPLRKAVVDLLRRERPSSVEMDLHGVTFLDSSGIRALLLCRADAEQLGCEFRLTEPSPTAYQVLHITGLLEHFGLNDLSPGDDVWTPCVGPG